MRALVGSLALMLGLGLLGCGNSVRGNGDGGLCTNVCTALGWQQCKPDGTYADPVACAAGQQCDPAAGCVICSPGQDYCGGPGNNQVWTCAADGSAGVEVQDCGTMACSNGMCKGACAAALDQPSNVGCDFWAVDLPNEATALNNAAAEQFALVIANDNDYPVDVTVTENTGRVGAALAEATVVTKTVPAKTAAQLDLPQREVDGTMGQNGTYARSNAAGSFVSPHAFHLVTSAPVVAYQFNPINQDFSNDASTLIPVQALGKKYVVLGYPTANPCAVIPVESIPDHTSVVVIPIEDNTHVTVLPTHPITATVGDSGLTIAQTPKGTPVSLTLNRYDVANFESFQDPNAQACLTAIANGQGDGDFTGTTVTSDKPVLVFSSAVRGIGFGGAKNVVYPPGWVSGSNICCTDHLEEQLFPVTALGRQFAVSRSPIRSTDPTWTEPDIVRVVGTVDNTTVHTNLPAPNDTFTLMATKQLTFAATTGFTLSADQPVEVGQILVSQQFIPMGYIGDPSLLTIPAAEQHRKQYVFLVPTTFRDNYIVVARPTTANISLDGTPLTGMETGCYTGPVGMIGTVLYDQITCKVTEGQHSLVGDVGFGLSVYGYYNVGSYAFVGGSDVKIINPIGLR
jgi:hypothetical protein